MELHIEDIIEEKASIYVSPERQIIREDAIIDGRIPAGFTRLHNRSYAMMARFGRHETRFLFKGNDLWDYWKNTPSFVSWTSIFGDEPAEAGPELCDKDGNTWEDQAFSQASGMNYGKLFIQVARYVNQKKCACHPE